ncbi:carbonic anhydrase 4-like [Denticeps clupeoides]|uniref:carbonic anhydrase 4-like n=1 Tax=Denticeps clupeoides TaxID=299321 RepID=UPI0010A4628E|nr:carbonic anhydrase 4-like [Denticeps clupeoides]
MTSIFFLAALLWPTRLCSGDWCYHSQFPCDTCKGPDEWTSLFPTCGGQSQSPINIVTRRVQYDPTLTPFVFEGYDTVSSITVQKHENNVHFVLPPEVGVQGGGLSGRYKATQLHLHWGIDGQPGSEHRVDGEQYAMELHIAHEKEQPKSEEDDNEHAVLAFFIEESGERNEALDYLLNAMNSVLYSGNQTSIDFRLNDIIPAASDLSGYYRYSGSRTTPSCEQNVVWTVFFRTIPVSRSQLNSVSRLWAAAGRNSSRTFRPTQRLNGRTVSCSTSALFVPWTALVWLSTTPCWDLL